MESRHFLHIDEDETSVMLRIMDIRSCRESYS